MTLLRQKMMDAMQVRGFSVRTHQSYPNHCINSDCNKVMQRASIHPGNATTRISRWGWHS